jgi:hypothetical protein
MSDNKPDWGALNGAARIIQLLFGGALGALGGILLVAFGFPILLLCCSCWRRARSSASCSSSACLVL